MTNRQMIMLKLIQLSDEEFAAFMDNEITVLMDGGLCQVCMEKHDGQCPMDMAPCIILWEKSISEAKAIPINELKNNQVFSVIQCIVQEIQKSKDFKSIVEEAKTTVKNYQDKNARHVYSHVPAMLCMGCEKA